MPDILIRGMEMPKTCSQCPLCYDYMMCSLRDGRFSRMGESFDCCEMRLADCPLIELPPHGDLIDMDKIRYTELYGGVEVTTANWIDSLPVVVPAERRDYP